MNTHTQRRTGSYIGLSVLALFAVAIIAGQARGELDGSTAWGDDLPTALELGMLVERAEPAGPAGRHEVIRKFRVNPVAIDFGVELLEFSENAPARRTGHETVL